MSILAVDGFTPDKCLKERHLPDDKIWPYSAISWKRREVRISLMGSRRLTVFRLVQSGDLKGYKAKYFPIHRTNFVHFISTTIFSQFWAAISATAAHSILHCVPKKHPRCF